MEDGRAIRSAGLLMVLPSVEGIDLFKIAGRFILGWIPSLKAGKTGHVRQPFCSQVEGLLLIVKSSQNSQNSKHKREG
jgi:hypothetical protein